MITNFSFNCTVEDHGCGWELFPMTSITWYILYHFFANLNFVGILVTNLEICHRGRLSVVEELARATIKKLTQGMSEHNKAMSTAKTDEAKASIVSIFLLASFYSTKLCVCFCWRT